MFGVSLIDVVVEKFYVGVIVFMVLVVGFMEM